MKAERNGRKVTLTMTASEAQALKDELLWVGDSLVWSIKTYETLADLDSEES